VTEDRKSILEDFLGTKCSGCGARKKPKMSHCRNCYYALPEGMRLALYRRFGAGYEEAFEASTKFLQAREPEDSVTNDDVDLFTRNVRGPREGGKDLCPKHPK
jgi:hypothetical protein